MIFQVLRGKLDLVERRGTVPQKQNTVIPLSHEFSLVVFIVVALVARGVQNFMQELIFNDPRHLLAVVAGQPYISGYGFVYNTAKLVSLCMAVLAAVSLALNIVRFTKGS